MRNEELVSALRVIGLLTIGLGVVTALLLLGKLAEPGPFRSRAQLDAMEVGIVLGVLFYHAILGILCFGVEQVLVEATVAAKHGLVHSEVERGDKAVSVTKCPKCGETYTGDLRGQFCESCGERL